MKIKRVLLGVVIASMFMVGCVWVLSKTLGNAQPALFRGQTVEQWAALVNAKDMSVSNQANAALNTEIIPQLENQMFHDTNDSGIRMKVVDLVNGLPGVSFVYYIPASWRRMDAARMLGAFGPAAAVAIPELMQAVQGSDPAVHEEAVKALGRIHGDPDKVIPFLTKYLDDDNLNDEAATALAEYGSLAKPAVPKIIPLLHAQDDDAQAAALAALEKIDPAALTNGLSTTTATSTNAVNATPKN